MQELETLISKFKDAKDVTEKIKVLDQEKKVKNYFQRKNPLSALLDKLSEQESLSVKTLIAIGQEHLFEEKTHEDSLLLLKKMARELLEIEQFYKKIDGIAGYHLTALKLMKKEPKRENITYHMPPYFNCQKEKEAEKKAHIALKNLAKIGAIFPVGGVGDRLGLIDPQTKKALPTAMLPFLGKTLLELLIQDVEAYENLYLQTFGKKIIIPIALMTSFEKKNHYHIVNVIERKNYFKRPKDSFFLFPQISVPLITEKGQWLCERSWVIAKRPGGHGVIWKLMQDNKVFDWFFSQGINNAFIRQINNPLASTDTTLLSLVGIGLENKKTFGFASCPRLVRSAEGMNVLREKKLKKGYEYNISNIEYTEFKKWNIKDVSLSSQSPYSSFPSNTNILFVDLKKILQAVKRCPLPGMVINMKPLTSYPEFRSSRKKIKAGRIELAMQNIADCITDFLPRKIRKKEYKKLNTFLTYNDRTKTISTTKRLLTSDNLLETPEGAYFDLLSATYDLLTKKCKSTLPPLDKEKYLKKGPTFIFLYHPALGPFYSIISQKIKKCTFYADAEVQLEVSDLLLKEVKVKGSLLILSKEIMGKNGSKCILKNVTIENRGIDKNAKNIYWQNRIKRKESFTLILHKNSEFIAKNMSFEGNIVLEVPENHKLTFFKKDEDIISSLIRK